MSHVRKSFLIHIDSLEILDDLTDEEAGQLFKKIKAHQKNEEMEVQPLVKIAFSPFKNQFQRDDEKYEKTVERNRNNGLKGGRPKTQPNPEEPKEPSGLAGNPTEPKKADSDSDSDSDSKKDKEKKPKKISAKLSLDDARIVEAWNSLGCVRHISVTKKAVAAIEKTYKEYCKLTDSPAEPTDWVVNYIKSGFGRWMTDHHRQMNDGQWAADLEFAVRHDTYEKVKSTVVTTRTASGTSKAYNEPELTKEEREAINRRELQELMEDFK